MHADNWAIKAKQMGYRSRAVFKLEEILKKTKTRNIREAFNKLVGI